MIIKIKKILFLLFILLGLGLSLSQPKFDAPAFWIEPNTAASLTNKTAQQPAFINQDTLPTVTNAVHCATSVVLDNGNVLAMWYGGTREGHVDVALFSSVLNAQTQTWSEPKKVLDRYDASNQLNRYIKKIGNPVLIKHPQGPIALVYVSVSLAGWATSQLNMALSYDDGQTWHASKRLVTSPFINVSTLVKDRAVIYQDGSIGITGYHELKGEFSELVRVTLDGEVINKYRMTNGTNTIQPSLIVNNEKEAFAVMRDSSRHPQKVHWAETKDGGQTWSPYKALEVDNPNSAIVVFKDLAGRNWMVFNDQTRDMENARNNLALAVSTDNGLTWATKHFFENKEKDPELTEKYAYPWLSQTQQGEYHLFYTESRKVIKRLHFNEAWLEGLL